MNEQTQLHALTPPQWVARHNDLDDDERLDALRAPLWALINKWETYLDTDAGPTVQSMIEDVQELLDNGFGE